MRQLITAQLGITMLCLLRFIDANQAGKDTPVPKKQEVEAVRAAVPPSSQFTEPCA